MLADQPTTKNKEKRRGENPPSKQVGTSLSYGKPPPGKFKGAAQHTHPNV